MAFMGFGLPLQVEGFKAKGLEDSECFKMNRSRVRRQGVKMLGMIGGIGPESTIEYYRLLIRAYRARVPDGSTPPILINSVNMKYLVTLFETNELAKVTEYLVEEIQKLADGGAHCGLLSANTPHVVFNEVNRRSPIPLVSIVEAACDAAKESGLKRVGLFGTRFTMQGKFYPDVFSRADIGLVIPKLDEQAYIHDKYMNELVKGIVSPATRRGLLSIVDRLKEEHHIDGLILGGTELTLILADVTDRGIPFLDTARIHVESVAARLWS
jgi:aspartate racemase